MPTYRSDQAAVHVTVDGVTLDTKPWDSFAGGDITANTVNYLPGGMQPAIDLGGVPQRSDITVEREWSDALIGVYKQLDQLCGRAAGRIPVTTLDANGVPVAGSTSTYTGTLKGVARPGYDSSTSGLAKMQLVFACNGSLS